MEFKRKSNGLIFLSSSDDEVVPVSNNLVRKNKSKPPNTISSTKSKRRNSGKTKNKKEDPVKLKQDIVHLFQKQKERVSGTFTEILLSDDSSDFIMRKPRNQSGSTTEKHTQEKDSFTDHHLDKEKGKSWITAAEEIVNNKLVSTKTNESLKKASSNIQVNGSTEGKESVSWTGQTSVLINSMFRPSSPGLLDSENNIPVSMLANTSEEMQVDVDPFSLVVSTNETDNNPESLSEEECHNETETENLAKREPVDFCGNLQPENYQKHINEHIPQERVGTVSKKQPAIVMLDGVKKQATITSFFGGKGTKPTLTFVAESSKAGTLKESVVKNTAAKSNEDTKDPIGTSGKRTCPFYKKIPGTNFVVDAFSYGDIPGVQHYFLSHFHSDHYMGLNKRFSHFIYCSQVTAKLVALKLYVNKLCLKVLPLNIATCVDGVEVTPVEANHCPGAVMFIFHFPKTGRRILHTGDFRFHSKMTEYKPFQDRIHQIFLDTTYLNPSYDFPLQEMVIDFVRKTVKRAAVCNPRVLVVCGTYTIGKERVFMAVAEVLNCLIWAAPDKQRVYKCLEEPDLNKRLTTECSKAQVHVLTMQKISHPQLRTYLESQKKCFDQLLAFRPTGWTHSKGKSHEGITPSVQGPISIYNVPYSEHSSFKELELFLKFLKPGTVIPTVNVGSQASRNQMNSFIQTWLRPGR